ncbi:MAG: sigma-70 family RNA polymerase sigma factor, partial [Armatimonadota bacterium]|nr:sigma-70 family RNA polymerase sigma factor [Armatimonadota bacterium]
MKNALDRAGIRLTQSYDVSWRDTSLPDASLAESALCLEDAPLRGGHESLEENSLQFWWRRVQQYPLLTAEREIILAERIEDGDSAAFNEMVECNLRLVANIARKCHRHAGPALSMADLIQEGSIGLMRAAKKFDHRKGCRFSTYACYWIRQAIMRAIADQARSIRLPVHVVDVVARTDRARAILTQQLQRSPSRRELASHLQMPENKVEHITDQIAEPVSLDVFIGSDDAVVIDFIEDCDMTAPEDCALRNLLREEVVRALTLLPEREAEVLCLRFGLDGS